MAPDEWEALAGRLRGDDGARRCAAVVGGGMCGLAIAHELVQTGIAVAVIDRGAPGEAPASSCAGLLDPLSVRGRIMWHGIEAFDAACDLLRHASATQPTGAPPLSRRVGSLHVAGTAKQRAQYEAALAEQEGPGAVCRYLTHDEAQQLAPGLSAPHGGLWCEEAVVVDGRAYLVALWRCVRAAAAAHGVAAEWIRKRVRTARELAGSFDLVIVAAGAGCAHVEETRHLPLELTRGQVVNYELPATGSDGDRARLRAALCGSVYVLPDPNAAPADGARAIVAGATHEPTTDTWQDAPHSADAADSTLRPALRTMFAALGAARQTGGCAGVRANPPRTPSGALPLAGRAHSDAAHGIWFATGFGARGLLYHALCARWVVAAASAGDAEVIPAELRRAEFGAMLDARLRAAAAPPETA